MDGGFECVWSVSQGDCGRRGEGEVGGHDGPLLHLIIKSPRFITMASWRGGTSMKSPFCNAVSKMREML